MGFVVPNPIILAGCLLDHCGFIHRGKTIHCKEERCLLMISLKTKELSCELHTCSQRENPDTHISDEFCLRKSLFRSEPFRVPLNSQLLKTFHPQAISGRNKKTTEISFIPIEEGMQPINGDYPFK